MAAWPLVASPPSALTPLASSRDKSLEGQGANKVEQAGLVGKLIAEKATKAGISSIRFDRGGYLYHGRVKSLYLMSPCS